MILTVMKVMVTMIMTAMRAATMMTIQIASRVMKDMIMTVMKVMVTMIMTVRFTLDIQNSGS